MRLAGKRAIITGAAQGIGKAIAERFAAEGASLLLADIDGARVAALAAELGQQAFTADVSNKAEVEALIAHADALWGGLDVLVNNAGIIRRDDLLQFSEEDWDAVMDTNLKTLFFLSQAAARHMAERGSGKIVNIASLLTFQGGIRVPSYAAAKSGVGGVTKAMANELAPKGVQVNAIAPGYIATNNTAALQADETRNRQILERIPTGRWGRPEDIAGAAVFLASEASDYVTGQVLAVDGGWLAR